MTGVFSRFSLGKAESTDFFEVKYGCFAWKVRMFDAKKSDVLLFPKGIFCSFSSKFTSNFRVFLASRSEKAVLKFGKAFENLRICT